MKRKIRMLLSIVLAVSLMISMPVFAKTEDTEYKFENFMKSTTPEIKTATYWHIAEYVPDFNDTFVATWSKVDKAKSYEVLVNKANGDRKIYRTTDTCLFVKKTDSDSFSGCPKVYCEKDSSWKAATVRIRAVYKYGIRGIWSKSRKITCNALHFEKNDN